MANYYCTVRTNYFHVKNEEQFKKLMERVYGYEDSVDLWEDRDAEGNIVFGFGAYTGILGVEIEDDEYSYDEFVKGLQNCVADDDAIIIMEAGNEKLRYVVGSALVITSQSYEYLDIAELAAMKAAEMLANPEWSTRCDY